MLQIPRMVHTATLVYADSSGATHTNTWNFDLLRNYVLPAALYFEDFESTPAGPDPSVPAGWVAQNFTGVQNTGNDPNDLNSDFYLGWVVVDTSFGPSKDLGVSSYSPQELNGKAFNQDTNPLLVNHYIRAESDSRQNGPPGQIQYVTTKPYDLTGKTGTVIAFNSSYEQNQDALAALEYSVDGGTNWGPVFYWVQGDFDSQGPADIFRDGLGNIDVTKTMTTSYGDVARYTDPTSGQQVRGSVPASSLRRRLPRPSLPTSKAATTTMARSPSASRSTMSRRRTIKRTFASVSFRRAPPAGTGDR